MDELLEALYLVFREGRCREYPFERIIESLSETVFSTSSTI